MRSFFNGHTPLPTMTFNTYQQQTKSTAIYPKENAIEYCTLGLCGEAGEIANKVKKIIRDNNGVITEQSKLDLKAELGDVQWYLARLADDLGFNLDDVVNENLQKLEQRKLNKTIKGSGDNR